jgi:predicted ATP-grasp superfamily ATP-dependent carboligase
VVLKPAIKEGFNRLTAAKAWRVDSHEELVARYVEACELVPRELLMVQELIPGGGESQLAFGALANEGVVTASVVARRTRQYPMDFGRASTFVQTVDDPEVASLAERLLARMGFTGLIEVEFKRDPRDGRYKLLDLNPRPWGWHTLSAKAGVDFPYLLWQTLSGESPARLHGRPDVSWMRLSTDLPTAVREIVHRRLSIGAYLSSFRGPRESAIFAFDDPAPGLLELPLLALVAGKRIARRGPV